MSNADVALLKQLYERFNARDIDRVLKALDEDVVWANGMEGGHVHGREGVRSYWTRQWAMVDPHVEPRHFTEGPDGKILVDAHQQVRDLAGTLLADRMVVHVFRIVDGFVQRFDILETQAAEGLVEHALACPRDQGQSKQ